MLRCFHCGRVNRIVTYIVTDSSDPDLWPPVPPDLALVTTWRCAFCGCDQPLPPDSQSTP